MRYKPNTVLPKGAKLILSEYKREIGSWVEMQFDAYAMRYGLKWLRVKGGFGGNGDREDWIADMPDGCLSVSRRNHRGFELDPFKQTVGSFDEAIKKELARAFERFKENRANALAKLRAANDALQKLTRARTKAALKP